MPMLTRIIENTINKSAISFNNCMDEDYSEDVIQCLYNIYPYILKMILSIMILLMEQVANLHLII